MAVAIDTIEVLDNLKYTHLNTADIYTVDADGMAGESVKTTAVITPNGTKAVRVIINNNYGATGSRVHVRAKIGNVSRIPRADLVVIDSLIFNWTAVALAGYTSGEITDISPFSRAVVRVDVAITGTDAHLGTEIIILVTDDYIHEDWTEWARVVTCSQLTAFKTDVLATAVVGQKVIPVNNPTAGNLDHLCKNIFILDATVANCEICWQTAVGADA